MYRMKENSGQGSQKPVDEQVRAVEKKVPSERLTIYYGTNASASTLDQSSDSDLGKPWQLDI